MTPVQRDVVVVGGGVMGVSAAYHLARAGTTRVTLLEAGELGSGSSAKPLGGVRAHFSDPVNIALGARSLAAYERFPAELGVDIGLRQVGYLFVVRDPADVAPFADGVALQRSMGVDSRMVDVREAVELCPALTAPGMVAAAWSPRDGYARPAAVIEGYAAAARALGVELRTQSPVLDITATADGQAVVRTAEAAYRAGAVVCTAGAWSRGVAAMAGVDLPVEPLRRQIALTPPLTPRPPLMPFTIDYTTTAYLHCSDGGGLLLGWADPGQPSGFDRDVTADWHRPLREALRCFVPGLADVPITGGWAGLYEMTPDCNAVVGESDAGFRFLHAAGFSGHGFLQAPAIGECLRDLHAGRPPVVDVAPLSLARFDRPAVRTELGIV